MLSKQSIRGKVEIYHEGTKLTKDDIIELSKEWSETVKKTSLEKC